MHMNPSEFMDLLADAMERSARIKPAHHQCVDCAVTMVQIRAKRCRSCARNYWAQHKRDDSRKRYYARKAAAA